MEDGRQVLDEAAEGMPPGRGRRGFGSARSRYELYEFGGGSGSAGATSCSQRCWLCMYALWVQDQIHHSERPDQGWVLTK